jgi:hypothetical protein
MRAALWWMQYAWNGFWLYRYARPRYLRLQVAEAESFVSSEATACDALTNM